MGTDLAHHGLHRLGGIALPFVKEIFHHPVLNGQNAGGPEKENMVIEWDINGDTVGYTSFVIYMCIYIYIHIYIPSM